MMDGSPLYPQGHHPIRLDYTADGIYDAAPLSRTDRPVRYYFIDFGLSTRFRPGESPLVYGTKGRDKDPPELSNEVPYNAFHLDVFLLGNVYKQELFQVRSIYPSFELYPVLTLLRSIMVLKHSVS